MFVYGSKSFPSTLGSLDGSNGFTITSDTEHGNLSITTLGDTNGDGTLDYAISSRSSTTGLYRVLVVTGRIVSQYVECLVPNDCSTAHFRCVTNDSIFDPVTQKVVDKNLPFCQTTETCVTTGSLICASTQKCAGSTLSTYDPSIEAKYTTSTQGVFDKSTQATYLTATQGTYDKGTQAT